MIFPKYGEGSSEGVTGGAPPNPERRGERGFQGRRARRKAGLMSPGLLGFRFLRRQDQGPDHSKGVLAG